nr:hydrogenase maturation protease [Kineosphaera limosa]
MLDDGFPPPACDLLVVGCGNLLRGDDAVGPLLMRRLWERGVPEAVRLVDGGTAGLDIAFQMRGAQRVVIVDAARTGAEPGTVYRIPAQEVSELPPLDGLNTHSFRWDHALAFSAWLLGPARPSDIVVYLIEGQDFEPGEPLSEPVAKAMEEVVELVVRDEYPRGAADGAVGTPPHVPRVELTAAGSLHLDAQTAAAHLPSNACVASYTDGVLTLLPLVDAGHGGLVLKQRTPAGDRSVLLSEVLGFVDLEALAGSYPLEVDERGGMLRVRLAGAEAVP